jgi:hypothetical protein
MVGTFIPTDIIDNYKIINFLPNKYWFIAVPTHFFVSLVYLFFMIQGYNNWITMEGSEKDGNKYRL